MALYTFSFTNKTYRWLLLGFAVALGLAALLWYASHPGAPVRQLHVLTMGTFSKAIGNTPYHVAKYLGYFEDHPVLSRITIRHVEYNDRPAIAQSFDAGDLHVLLSAEIPALLCFAQGNQIRIVEIAAVANQEILVPTGSPIEQVRDLRGETLAVLPGTSSHYCLIRVLRDNGMSMDDLDVTFMSPGEAKVAFETGNLPAWAVWAPWVEQQEVARLGRPIADSKAAIASVMTMTTSLLDDHPDVARAVLEVLWRSKEWSQENTRAAQQIAADELDLDISVVEKAWPKFEWTVRLTPAQLPDLQDKAQFLADNEQTRDNRLIAVEDAVDLQLGRN